MMACWKLQSLWWVNQRCANSLEGLILGRELVIVNAPPAHKTLVLDFDKRQHFAEAGLVVQVELVAPQLNHYVGALEWF